MLMSLLLELLVDCRKHRMTGSLPTKPKHEYVCLLSVITVVQRLVEIAYEEEIM